MLEKLGFKTRTHVGISLSANNFIELVHIDRATKTVVKYASGNIKYNSAIKEIIDFDEFADVVEGLFQEAGLEPSTCAVTFNLPNVHFAVTQMESAVDANYIVENLTSEIEDLYIFKRNEPTISYSMSNSTSKGQKNIVYGAVQTKVIAKIIDVFDSLDCELVRIDTSYSSMLKTIQYCDRFSQYIQHGEKTSILLITPNSCCSILLNGATLVECLEEPLAVKSFSEEEVYSTISKIASNSIYKNSPDNLLVISETDEINAEVLSQRIEFSGTIDHINKSLSQNDTFIDVASIGTDIDSNMISYMTIEAVGAACADYDDYPLNLNFLPSEMVNPNMVMVGEYEIDFFRFVLIAVGGAISVALIIVVLFYFIMTNQKNMLEGKNTEYRGQIEVFNRRINDNKNSTSKTVFPVLSKVLEDNKSIVAVYTALSTDIPDTIYIKKFITNSQGGIGIIGEATTSESVQNFVNGLREKNADLTLSKLSINSRSDFIPSKIPNGFTFEIKTSGTDISLEQDEDYIPSGNSMTTQSGTTSRSRYSPPPSPII